MPKSLLDTFPDIYSTEKDLRDWIKEMSKNKTLTQRSANPKDKIKYTILQKLIKAFHARIFAMDAVKKLYASVNGKDYSPQIEPKMLAYIKAFEKYEDTKTLEYVLNSLVKCQGQAFDCNIPANSHDIKRNKRKFQALLNAYTKYTTMDSIYEHLYTDTFYKIPARIPDNPNEMDKSDHKYCLLLTHSGYGIEAVARAVANIKGGTMQVFLQPVKNCASKSLNITTVDTLEEANEIKKQFENLGATVTINE